VHGLLATLPADGEIVVVDDASTDGSSDFLGPSYPTVRLVRAEKRLGSPCARNAGARAARGPILVFCDAHVLPPFGWPYLVTRALAAPEVGAAGAAVAVVGRPTSIGYGLAWRDDALNPEWLPWRDDSPYPVPILGGAFLAIRSEVFRDVGGFDEGIVDWGGEDAELSLRLWLLGYTCLVLPRVAVAHEFRARLPHTLRPGALSHNLLRIGAVHFGRDRLARLVAELARRPDFPVAVARLLDGDYETRRSELRARRRHDDDWYFEQFADVLTATRTEVSA
jgi:cellulose synthase/poly-beta-1,6-N-acetylglucosamine synthase-like glycosyltransferase